MERIIHTIKEYQDISSDVWKVFKKYFPDDAVLDDFTLDIDVLDKRYRSNPRLYEFMQKLMRVYFDELHELKVLKEKYEQNG